MNRFVGTVSRGIRTPIIAEGDDIVDIVVNSILEASKYENIEFKNKDIIAITEAVVARAQGNYASIDDIAADVKSKYPDGELGLLFPILSRNRFSINLRGVARAAKKIYLQLSYPADEVGNQLISSEVVEQSGINPFSTVLNEKEFYDNFGKSSHPYTGVDYIQFYKEIIESEGCEVEIIFSNHPETLLDYTDNILTCDIHSRKDNLKRLENAGAKVLHNIDSILSESINGSGYNKEYGMLGANKATEEVVKLFPNDCQEIVDQISQRLSEESGKNIEVMIYGDGAFRDPSSKIWELADPVVSPAYTSGLAGEPEEVKLKYIADNNFSDLRGEELNEAVLDYIKHKDSEAIGKTQMLSEGTTPRKIADLVGSLADLTSGSGDKGTPVVWIQGYFDDIAAE
ncbi:coenzyme F420-0:L-glutamate ligase [Fastidiosipila sanguinis]|uniref:F420-0--gamma-glutamyl ligase n=1 Tax=Fastidiosipila sanguinis TaxID=236753 RepID=A0A2S0KLU6_9FIRM|nr:coenzyme F420-0:L-glutamate ligase [Fastidiosipila sanguinis]AVM41988.1 F420-0--gamma-glutamyl ligase [Fastidiosipila sanguinis]